MAENTRKQLDKTTTDTTTRRRTNLRRWIRRPGSMRSEARAGYLIVSGVLDAAATEGPNALFLGTFVIRIRAGGMVGDIDDVGQLRNRLHQDPLDSLFQRHLGHPAPLAAAAEF